MRRRWFCRRMTPNRAKAQNTLPHTHIYLESERAGKGEDKGALNKKNHNILSKCGRCVLNLDILFLLDRRWRMAMVVSKAEGVFLLVLLLLLLLLLLQPVNFVDRKKQATTYGV